MGISILNEHLQHITNFFDSRRSGKPVVEEATCGFRAAPHALACNDSYFQKKIIDWDPENMKLVKGDKVKWRNTLGVKVEV